MQPCARTSVRPMQFLNRSHLVALLAVVALAGGAGWAVAYFEHEGRVKQAATAALAEARRPGIRLAEVVRQCDAAALVFLRGKEEQILPIADTSWRERLAVLLENGAYEPTNRHLLGISYPLIRLTRSGVTVLELMVIGQQLQAYGSDAQGEFLISPELASALLNLRMVDLADT
jgi:hypothetical protein